MSISYTSAPFKFEKVCKSSDIIAANVHHLPAILGNFREDLFYRINTIMLNAPPLRRRKDDIAALITHFLQTGPHAYLGRGRRIDEEALGMMMKYDWPGNIRQLQNRIKKALVLCDRKLLGPDDLDIVTDAENRIVPLEKAKEEFQRLIDYFPGSEYYPKAKDALRKLALD